MEAVSWFAAQSARCTVRRVSMVLIFLEDFGGHVRDGPASPWSSREFQDLERACDVRRGPVGILTNLPTLQSRLSTLAHPGKMWRRIIPSRPTSSIMSVRSSACSVQGNGRTGALLIFQIARHDSLFGRPRHGQFLFPLGRASIPSQCNGFIHTFSFSSCSHSTLLSLVGRHTVAGFAQRFREPWTGRSCFLWHSWCCAAVVFFHFVLPRHAVEFGFVTFCVAVFAGLFELPFAVLHAHAAVFAGTFKLTPAAVFVSGYGLFASSVCPQASLPFSCCSFTEILTWSFETSPGPNEAEG